MFKKLRSNYNVSFIADILLKHGSNGEWGTYISGSYGYEFKSNGTGILNVPGMYDVAITRGFDSYNIEAIHREQRDVIYIFLIDIATKSAIARISVPSLDIDAEGGIDNNTMNAFVKKIIQMYERKL